MRLSPLVLLMLRDIDLDELVLGVLSAPEPLPRHREQANPSGRILIDSNAGDAHGLTVRSPDLG